MGYIVKQFLVKLSLLQDRLWHILGDVLGVKWAKLGQLWKQCLVWVIINLGGVNPELIHLCVACVFVITLQ